MVPVPAPAPTPLPPSPSVPIPSPPCPPNSLTTGPLPSPTPEPMPPTADSTFDCVGGVLLATSAAEGIGALGEGIPAALAAGAITTGDCYLSHSLASLRSQRSVMASTCRLPHAKEVM